jgi:hypothetical protein
MGIELEWFILLIISVLGNSIFRQFASGAPIWQLISKWLTTMGITYLLYQMGGHQWALGFLFSFLSLGIAVHFLWCGYHEIHPWRATPKAKYYALRGWKLEE